MKYLFSLLLLLSFSQLGWSQCTYVIDMQDSFGDGWNGASLDVNVNGTFLANYTLPNGSTGQDSFTVNNLDVVTFTYNSGTFDGEVTYQISLAGGQLFADGPNPTTGLVFTHQCGGCDPPTNIAINNITSATADVTWVNGGGNPTDWIVEYGTAGFTLGSGTSISTTTNPVNLTGLTDNTTYDVYIYSVCASGDTSLPAGPISFITACLPVTVYPFWEGFNSTSPTQSCWRVVNQNNDPDAWNMDYSFNPYEGDECAAINTDFNNGNNDDYLISPQFTLTGGERLRFRHRANSTNEPNNFRLLMSTTGNAPADFTTVLLEDTATQDDYVERVVELYAYTGDVYLAFHIPPGSLDGWILYIDDILIEQPPVNDAGVSGLTNPTIPTASGFTAFEAEVTNFGIAPLNSFTVEWEIAGATQPSVAYTGNTIAPGDQVTIPLANLNLPNGSLDVKIWTTMPNGVPDENVSNDTLDITLCPGLSGVYSVGHTSSDFPTFADAMNALQTCGVSGPVTMEFHPGTYNGPWVIGKIPGASATNTVTFDGLATTAATLTHDGFGINTAGTLILDGAEHFRIRNFRIENTGTNTAYGVLLINNARFNAVENNVISVPVSASVTNVIPVLASASYDNSTGVETEGNNSNWNLIKDNDISGGNAGVVLEGGERDSVNYGNQIVGNTIHDAQEVGIFMDEQDSVLIQGNNIFDILGPGSDAIVLFDVHNYAVIENNINITDRGISVQGGFLDPCTGGFVANNMVNSTSASGEALSLNQVNIVYVYHNTLQGAPACFLNNYGNVDLRNNILATAAGFCFETPNPSAMAGMDYNLYYISNAAGMAVDLGGTTYATLALWQAAPAGYDQNSVTGNPNFVNGLHVGGTLPVDAGVAGLFVPVTVDIDGDSRPLGTAPDIGADEHIVVSNDAMAVSLVSPSGCGDLSSDVIVEIANVGSDTLISIPVTVNVSGVANSTFNATQPAVFPSTTVQLNMGSLNTSAGGTYNFEIIVSAPADVNQANDTLLVTVDIMPSNQVALTMTGDNIVCDSNRANVSATASYAPATILWYDAPTGGNLVHVGTGFTSGPLTNTTMYYAQVQGCNSPRAIATINLDTLGIDLDLGADQTVCGGSLATINSTVTVSSATSYMWSEGSQSTFINVGTSGQYSATVTNANGCIDADTVMVTVSPEPSVASNINNVTCGSAGNGAIDLTVTGGTGPFAYLWSNAEVTQDISGLAGGVYNVTITDNGTASGCSYVQTFNVVEPLPLAVNIDNVTPSCNGNDGGIDITVSGGTSNYTYNWSNNTNQEDVTSLAAGTHTVTVTDVNGCTATATGTLNAVTPITVNVDTVINEVLAVAGSINTTIAGGSGSLQYLWNTGATTDDVTGLTAGTYTLTVTDAVTGCQTVTTVVVEYKIPDFVNQIEALNSFNLYPNPTSGQVWVTMELKEATTVQLEILSITGQLLQSFEPRETLEQNYELDLSTYPSGVYMVRFVVGQEVMTTRIIVE